jgi:hypothetical protein
MLSFCGFLLNSKHPDDMIDEVLAPNRNVSYLFMANIAQIKILAIKSNLSLNY